MSLRPFSRWLTPALAVFSVALVVVRNSRGLAELLVNELSPAEVMALGDRAQGLAHGFPSGAELTAISAPLRLYAVFDALGFGVVGATRWMIALEALAFFIGIYAAARILRPVTTNLVAGLAATVATVGYALSGHNLANFGFLYGWNYGFAAAAATVTLAYALRQRWTACVCMVVLVGTIHSVIGVLLVLALVPLAILDIVRRRFSLRWKPIALVVGAGAVYLLASRGDVQLPTVDLDVGAYIARTRAFQSHYFFEFSFSFLRSFAEDIAAWLIAVTLILVAGLALRRLDDASLADRTVVIITTIGVLSMLGWAHSNLAEPNVTLLVLTLHRSSTFVNLLLLALVVPLLFEQAMGRRLQVTAAAVAVWCLLPGAYYHARFGVVVLALAVCWAYVEVKERPNRRSIATAVAMAPLVCLALYFLLVALGVTGRGWDTFFETIRSDDRLLLAGVVLVSLALFARWRRADEHRLERGVAVSVVIVAALWLVLGNTLTDNPRAVTGVDKQRAVDLIDVAAWARHETPNEAVFLLPLHDDGFGWRTFSERATAGLPREWLHYAFLYSRDERVMDEGTRRVALLGIDADVWFEEHPKLAVGGELVAEIATTFEQMTDVEAAEFADELGVDFLVVAAGTESTRAGPCFRSVYSNASFVVLELQKECLST
jgi:hypothetical protein